MKRYIGEELKKEEGEGEKDEREGNTVEKMEKGRCGEQSEMEDCWMGGRTHFMGKVSLEEGMQKLGPRST